MAFRLLAFQQKPTLRLPTGDHRPRPQLMPQRHGRNDRKVRRGDRLPGQFHYEEHTDTQPDTRQESTAPGEKAAYVPT